MNFTQKLRLFSDIYSCMDIMMGLVREDTLITSVGSTWPGKTNWIADTAAERTCQSKMWYLRMETKWWINSPLTLLPIFSGDDHQLPTHYLKRDILLILKQAEKIWLIPKASENG